MKADDQYRKEHPWRLVVLTQGWANHSVLCRDRGQAMEVMQRDGYLGTSYLLIRYGEPVEYFVAERSRRGYALKKKKL